MSQPEMPAQINRRALVCVLGKNPQILTETLYALVARSTPAWIPTEIHVITTTAGAVEARKALFGASGKGRFTAFCDDFASGASIQFDGSDRHIHVIERDGRPLEDIDDQGDNDATGNTILRVVAPLAADDRCAIHASIAGGRKTMGSLLSSIMSIVGRPQDRASHVLVPQFVENHPEFFYPPRLPQLLTLRDGSTVSTADVDIKLALVRLLTIGFGAKSRVLEQGLSYEELVTRAEEGVATRHLELSLASCTVRMGRFTTSLEPLEMAWYAYLAQRRVAATVDGPDLESGMVTIGADALRSVGIDVTALKLLFARFTDLAWSDSRMSDVDFKPAFASRVSDINRKLREGLGDAMAYRAQIVGPGMRGKRDGKYGLLYIEPGLVRIL